VIPFADFSYLALALYVSLPALVLGLVKRFRQASIVLASLIMLAIQYWTPRSASNGVVAPTVWLVSGFALYQWFLAASFIYLRRRGENRWAFRSFLLLGLLPLVGAKFLPFFIPGFSLVFLGLSYITFRSLDVIINIQDGLILSLPPLQYLVFLLFFPSVSSGPIDRYRRFQADWMHFRPRNELLKDLDGAVQHVFTGFLYKFILAALIKTYWLDPAASGAGLIQAASYMYAYSFYLFFDFAGYSAFAIGFSYLFGIYTPENFNRPFFSRNPRDFWNRWHISLSWWFRDHVYSRFVFSALKGHRFKNKYTASYLGLFLSFGLMGLWHGLAWRYIVYGLYHAALLVSHDGLSRWNKSRHWLPAHGFFWQAASIFVTFNLVCFSLLIFSGRLG
jgi:membrane protein involved in D-alanine export